MNPALPLLILGHAPGTQAVEVVPRSQLARLQGRFSAQFVAVPRGAAPLTFPDYSRARVSEVERLLEQARTGASALAEQQAAAALTEAERILREHPELPQAAWLMAERHAIAARLADNARDPVADELRARARALEPERAVAFGQDARVETSAGSGRFTLEIRGVSAEERIEWDGRELSFPAEVQAGEHLLRVQRGGRLVWAGWVTVTPSEPTLELQLLPRAETCSHAELGATTGGAAGPLPPGGVSCPAWAVLRLSRGRAELALCRRSLCGRWHVDAEPPVLPARADKARGSESRIPTWATIAIASAGAAVLTGVTLWQTGAFDREQSGRPRWVYEGFVPPDRE